MKNLQPILLRKDDYIAPVGAFISGILAFIAVSSINFWLIWICYVPLFISIIGKSPKESFKLGFIFGFGIYLFALFWIVTGTERFTGSSMIYGIMIFLILLILYSSFWALISYSFSALKVSFSGSRISYLANGLLMVSVFIVAEFLLNAINHSMPWFAFNSGYGLMGNLYAVQPVAYFGMPVLTFIVVAINYAIAYFILEKQYIKLLWPISGIIGYLLIGYFILAQFEKKTTISEPINIAILSENIPPDIRWDDNTGNALVNRLINLDHQASSLNPDIALWSESAIPWTYKPDDDLVNELLRITAPASVTHILGMNTEYAENQVYNSAYSLLPNNEVAERYDKRFLLGLIEKPILGVILPFLSSGGYSVKKGQNDTPLSTPYGKAGIMICNEVVVYNAAVDMVKNGARFLLNISNDGWFRETYIVPLHFYNARMRAIETRKDIVVNSNNGISGHISASGRIQLKTEQTKNSFVKVVSVSPNNHDMEQFRPKLLIYMNSIVLLSFLIAKFYKKTLQS